MHDGQTSDLAMRSSAPSASERTRWIVPVVALLGIALMGTGVALFIIHAEGTRARVLIDQTQALGSDVREVHMHYLQAVSSLRLYVNSRNPLQVADHEAGLRDLATGMVQCRKGLVLEPDVAQRAGIESLLAALEERMSQLRRARATFDAEGMARLTELTRELDTDQADRRVKDSFASLIARKSELMAQRERNLERIDLRFQGMLALFVAVSLILSAVLFVRGQREWRQRREADKALRQTALSLKQRTEELEHANRELESFSFSVSHDLRSPVRNIEGYAAVLEEELGAERSVAVRDCVKNIREGSRRMSELISDVLAFSKLGREPLETAPVHCEALVQEVWAQTRESWPHSAAKLVVESLPDAVGDGRMLRQVWVNLLDNAIKYSSRSTAPTITVSGIREGNSVVYCVQDNGVGFDMAQSARLFGVFQRLHSEAEFGGTGAGLAIARRIVERHGGRMWATSAVGAGAQFSFSLPVT